MFKAALHMSLSLRVIVCNMSPDKFIALDSTNSFKCLAKLQKQLFACLQKIFWRLLKIRHWSTSNFEKRVQFYSKFKTLAHFRAKDNNGCKLKWLLCRVRNWWEGFDCKFPAITSFYCFRKIIKHIEAVNKVRFTKLQIYRWTYWKFEIQKGSLALKNLWPFKLGKLFRQTEDSNYLLSFSIWAFQFRKALAEKRPKWITLTFFTENFRVIWLAEDISSPPCVSIVRTIRMVHLLECSSIFLIFPETNRALVHRENFV